MSYKIGSGGIFPYIEMEDYAIHIMTNFDQPNSEMDFSITSGRIIAFHRSDIPQSDLIDLIKEDKIYPELTNANLSTLIEKNKNKILHFVENHDDYMRGPPYPDYENIKD